MDERGFVSMHCWNGKHRRCTGWCVVPDETNFGRAEKCDQSITCGCHVCLHPQVHRFRHHVIATSVKGNTWSSSTTTPS